MDEKLAAIEAKFNALTEQLADPEIANDYAKYAELAKQRSDLEATVEAYRARQKADGELADARAMAAGEDPDMAEMARAEIEPLEKQVAALNEQLRTMLLPKDPRDDRNVIVEIRAGAGGDEAGLFAADLYRMYTRYAETRRWKVEELDESETGIGGFKEVIFAVNGKGAYSRLKWESGVHRVQRIPSTESNGRIHTSTVTVAVLPEIDDVEINIPPGDIEIETFRSRGAGGQNVQKNESAVRITHKPTGTVVAVQDERSQTQNRLRAMSILRSKLFDLEQSRINEAHAKEKSAQVGTGERSEKIRTYNYPQNRVTDHRIGMDLYRLEMVMNGDIDEFIDELINRDQAEKLEAVA
ncbi:MAG TPA: peptide chain release factor 1 [Thermoflexales bacterium]|nr:peptide chain release factor 1 [Thermoflexales bacterium]HQW36149.1 peptide chain release factor 1 [Thermoflexales bacterium]HQX75040.1 peptide chain release factor 1 [Thermoflexales bacterium]HQZ21958.1 peptide chain release factor 1 [Thermoflexales bacterium]